MESYTPLSLELLQQPIGRRNPSFAQISSTLLDRARRKHP